MLINEYKVYGRCSYWMTMEYFLTGQATLEFTIGFRKKTAGRKDLFEGKEI